jgi:hypothetical protein
VNVRDMCSSSASRSAKALVRSDAPVGDRADPRRRALLIALDANMMNDLVTFVLDTADKLDLGVFDIDEGVKHFTGKNAKTKNALLNGGLAAIVWRIAGRILDRIIRP